MRFRAPGCACGPRATAAHDKVAEYVDTDTPLAEVGEPTLNYTTTEGTIPPGFQLVIDLDGDGTGDGILVGEPTFYGANWWLNNGADAEVKALPRTLAVASEAPTTAPSPSGVTSLRRRQRDCLRVLAGLGREG